MGSVVKSIKERVLKVYKDASKKYRESLVSKIGQFVGPWACKCYYQFKIGLVEELALDIKSSTK